MNKSIHSFGRIVIVAMVFLFVIGSTLTWAECKNDDEFTQVFRLGDDCNLVNEDLPGEGNPYFSLELGYQLVLEGEEDGEDIFVVITVLDETVEIVTEDFGTIVTRVVEESEWVDGELVEVSRNYFARCEKTNAVYYFGEDVENYEPGEPMNNEGSWRAEGDNKPGLIMPGTFILGSRYFQEYAPDDGAVDRGENVAMGLTATDPEGGDPFTGCVEVVDTNPAEKVCKTKAGDVKIYCPGIGLVMDEEIELTCYGDCSEALPE
jgi:hypothetical protein